MNIQPEKKSPPITLRITEKTKRLDVWLAAQLPNLTRSRISELIRQGHIRLNQKTTKPAQPLSAGDTVSVYIPEPQPLQKPAPENIPLDILYEDEHITAINKPPGLIVHPGAGNHHGTLVSALLHHYQNQLSTIGGVLRPGIVHRLDKDTSGILLIARNDAAHQVLARLFHTRRVEKHYIALCARAPQPACGKWNGPIGRHPVERKKMTITTKGRPATTLYRTLETNRDAALLHMQILTGRTHQIRVHATHAGCPLLGDPLYGRQHSLASRTMLHAACIRLPHPINQKPLELHAPIPGDFLQQMRQLNLTIPQEKIHAQLLPLDHPP